MAAPAPAPARDSFKLRWDVLLFCVFVFAAMPHATGIFSHEWIGVALVPVLLVHLMLNWDWIVSTTRRMFSALPGEIRFNHVWDALLFVIFILATVSGLMISRFVFPALGIPHRADGFWIIMHTVSATILTLMIGIHIALHLRWVLARLKRAPAVAPEAAKKGKS
jgi:hypothetical protein